MKKFEHNTIYYGYDILTAIANIHGRPVMDRGGLYLWIINDNTVLLYDSVVNNFRGTLEFHRPSNGMSTLIDQMDVLDVLNDELDYFFNKEKIERFVRRSYSKEV